MERKEIRTWVDCKMPELVETLKEICRIRSVAETQNTACPPYGEGCREVLQTMLRIGSEAGFETTNFENYVGRISLPGSNPENIGIWAHLDAVEEGEGWEYSPYEPIVKDGYFIARGCQDNKSSAVMALYVLKFMKEHQITLNHTLDLYLGTCEEKGMFDLDYYTKHYAPPTLSLVPDSGFPVCCGERGTFNGDLIPVESASDELLGIDCDCGQFTIPDKAGVVLRYTPERWALCEPACEKISVSRKNDEILLLARGVSSQSANPNQGDNALTRLAVFICDRKLLPEQDLQIFAMVRDINQDLNGRPLDIYCEDDLSGPILLSVTQMFLPEKGGKPVIHFVAKYPVSRNDFPYEERAGAAAAKKGFTLKTTKLARANYFDPERPVVARLTACSNEGLNRQDKPFVMSGGTYARKLPNAFAFGTGMPLPKAPEGMFLPGHGDYHQPDESISLDRIRKALEIYITGILQIDDLDLTL